MLMMPLPLVASPPSASGGTNFLPMGPTFGYFPNASKIWLITKDALLDEAKEMFIDTEVRITLQGRPHLGAPQVFVKHFIAEKVNQWTDELSLLVDAAKTQPHAAFAAFVHGYVHKFNYLGYTPMYNFSPVYFLYFLQALFLSDFTSRTPNKDQQVEQLYYCLSSKFYNPETSMSSAVAALLHAIRTGVKIVPREKSGTKRFAWTDSHDSNIIL